MSEAAITSVAILKVNWDAGRDYIENFVPFVAECLRLAPQPEVSIESLQADVRKNFGFVIPQGALQTILRRAAKRGYVRVSDRLYYRNDVALATLEFSATRGKVVLQYEALIHKLMAFCMNKFQLNWSELDADTALLRYLEEYAPSVLGVIIEGRTLSGNVKKTDGTSYVVGSFISEIVGTDPEGFEFLETIVKGLMLSSALHYPDLGQVQGRFDDTEIYFDTSFILQVLGLDGESKRAPRLELVNLLYRLNARLCVFRHTLDEVRSVLSAASHALRNYPSSRFAYGPTIQHLIDSNYTSSDVELVIARLEKSLRSIRIEVKDKPAHSTKLGVNETRLQSLLQDSIGYSHQEPLFHDVDSITAIHRLRQGQTFMRIESCKALFVTPNKPLAESSADFFKKEYQSYGQSTVPHCMLDHLLTSIVWLKQPHAAPDLPRKRVIADCYVAMNPKNHLWQKYLNEIDKLRTRGDISPEDYDLLRMSLSARSALMDLTLGDSDVFTEGTVKEILERAHAAIRRDTEKALQEEKDAKNRIQREAAKNLEETRRAAESALAAERAARIEVEKGSEAQRQAQLDKMRDIAASIANWVATGVFWAAIVILSAIVYLALFLPDLPGGWWLPLVIVAFLLLGGITVASLVFGATLMAAKRKLEDRISRSAEAALKRRFGL